MDKLNNRVDPSRVEVGARDSKRRQPPLCLSIQPTLNKLNFCMRLLTKISSTNAMPLFLGRVQQMTCAGTTQSRDEDI